MAEAKETLSWEEVNLWTQYIDKNGPLSVGQRLDVGLARIMLLLAKTLGGKNSTATFQDFLPSYYRKGTAVGEDEELTLEGMYKLFE